MHTTRPLALRPFRIMFGPRGAPRLVLPVYAADSCSALEAHLCLAAPCERVEVAAA